MQSQQFVLVRPICERLAYIASCCAEYEFQIRLDFLRELCDKWAGTCESHVSLSIDFDHKSTRNDNCNDVRDEIADDVSEVGTVVYDENDLENFPVDGDLTLIKVEEEKEVASVNKLKNGHNEFRKSTQNGDESLLGKQCIKVRMVVADEKNHKTMHKCRYCARVFTYSGHLRRHSTVHEHNLLRDADFPYVCYACCGRYETPSDLLQHLLLHDNDVNAEHQVCDKCQRTFKSFQTYLKHSARCNVNGNKRAYVCLVCSKRFFHQSSLSAHERLHSSDTPLTCSICNKWMSNISTLRAHLRLHSPNASVHTCPICNKRFTYASSLRSHINRHGTGAAIDDTFKCWRCESEFMSHSSLMEHLECCPAKYALDNTMSLLGECSSTTADSTSTSVLRTISSKNENHQVLTEDSSNKMCISSTVSDPSPKNGASLHVMLRNQKMMERWQRKYPDRTIVPHTCSVCRKQFLQAVQLRKHMIKHAEGIDGIEFPYSCCECHRNFLFANDLKRHLISHSNDRPHVCVVCRRPFKREDDLAKHMRTHDGVRPYMCATCGDSLPSATKLRKHVRKAHGDRYECTVCGIYFAKRGQFSRHKRLFHTDESTVSADGHAAPSPFMCDRCGRSYRLDTDLRNHMYKSHARRRALLHACSWCHRQFASTSHLLSHERTHTGDRPFTCDSCGKQFTQSGSLNVHRRTHVEPQPFSCHICGQRFASKQYAKKHYTMRHAAGAADAVGIGDSAAAVVPALVT